MRQTHKLSDVGYEVYSELLTKLCLPHSLRMRTNWFIENISIAITFLVFCRRVLFHFREIQNVVVLGLINLVSEGSRGSLQFNPLMLGDYTTFI